MDPRPDSPPRHDEPIQGPAEWTPVFVDLGDGLGRLEVWSPARWDSTEPCDRPAHAEYREGLGWVVAAPVRDLN